MKCRILFALVLGSALVLSSGSPRLAAQVCHDEEDMVGVFKSSVADLVETVKKESFVDFEKAFHQKSAMTKLSLLGNFVEGLLNCLQKRANDPATLKEDADAAKAKIDLYSKLKDKIKRDRDALKAAQTEKEAKALIEKFAYSK
jgi:Na+-transporting NADH:ubiquinone oxidoreductase subunit NqrA